MGQNFAFEGMTAADLLEISSRHNDQVEHNLEMNGFYKPEGDTNEGCKFDIITDKDGKVHCLHGYLVEYGMALELAVVGEHKAELKRRAARIKELEAELASKDIEIAELNARLGSVKAAAFADRYSSQHIGRVSNGGIIPLSVISECLISIHAFNDLAGNLAKSVNPELEAHMLYEEVKEYAQACRDDNQVELRDAVSDILVVLYGTILKHGLSDTYWNDLKAVCESNMSKFCKTEGEAKESVSMLRMAGEDVHAVYNSIHGMWVIMNAAGKVRKSINFKLPSFHNQ